MDEEPVFSRGKGMPRSTMMVLVLGSVALLLCTASALVGGVFLGALVFQAGGGGDTAPAFDFRGGAPVAPTMVRPGSADSVPAVPTAPAPDFMQATPTPIPFGAGNAVTATPLPFGEMPTAIP